MIKRILTLSLVCACVFWGVWQAAQREKRSTSSVQIPTEAVAQVRGEKDVTTQTPSPTVPEQTPTATPVTNQNLCNSLAVGMKKKAQEFMVAHTAHDSAKVLAAMSPPQSDDESIQLNFLTGMDSGIDARLYSTVQTSFTTTSFTLGGTTYAGQDANNRGNDLCSMLISETRKVEGQDQFSEQSVTRYLDFSISPDMSFQIQAFKNGKNGAKYSGFNN